MTESYDNPSTRAPGSVPTSGDLDAPLGETLPPSYPAGSGDFQTGTLGTTTYQGAHVADDRADASKTEQAKAKAAEVKDQVAGEAQNVKQTAVEAGSRVAGTAKEQAANVAGEARRQAKDVLQQGRTQLTSQVSSQQQKAVGAIRSLSSELTTMAGASQAPGVASDLVHQAAGVVDSVASWFENKEPAEVLEEVTHFARRRPGVFLAIAAGAGLVVGRLARGLKDDAAAQAQADAQPEYLSAGHTTATTGYSTDAYAPPTTDAYATPTTGTTYGAPTTDPYTTPTTSTSGSPGYTTRDVPGTTTGGYGGTA